MSNDAGGIRVRHTTPSDFAGIIEISRTVYPNSAGWEKDQLASHHKVFPEGQIVAYQQDTGRIVGMAASLVVL
ncbi:MAG: hydrolase, partial [Gemmatimonadales bacterium]